MSLYKVSVQLTSRSVSMVLKSGVLATMETGSSVNGIRRPKNRIVALVGEGQESALGWLQVSEFNASGVPIISHEGWVNLNTKSQLFSLFEDNHLPAHIEEVDNPTEEMLKCQTDAKFGLMTCCTSYGNGCYVTCCNSCCADPYGCPGASCCG